MGLLLQIIGVLILIISLGISISAIINGTSGSFVVVLVLIGGFLVRLGRKIHNNKEP